MTRVIVHVLTAIYESFWAAVLFAILIGCLDICLRKLNKNSFNKFKYIWKMFIDEIKGRKVFKFQLLYYFIVALILFRTLINRDMWANPLENVLGVWGFYRNGEFTTEIIENFILFIPFSFSRIMSLDINKQRNVFGLYVNTVYVSFLFSLSIETLQLLLRLGTFEISDIFFNTVGGLTGEIIFLILYNIKKRCKKNV